MSVLVRWFLRGRTLRHFCRKRTYASWNFKLQVAYLVSYASAAGSGGVDFASSRVLTIFPFRIGLPPQYLENMGTPLITLVILVLRLSAIRGRVMYITLENDYGERPPAYYAL